MTIGTSTRSSPDMRSAWLVAEREIGSRLRSRSFVISTLILFLMALGGVVWAGIAANTADPTTVAVTAATATVVPEDGERVAALRAADAAEAIRLVQDGEADAAIVPDEAVADQEVRPGTGFGFTIVARESPPTDLVAMLSQSPPVHLLEPPSGDGPLRYLVAVAFGVVFFVSAATFGGMIAQSVVEEKQTRVVEILLSAIPAGALLAGKVLGNTILAVAQTLILAAIAIGGLSVTGQDELVAALTGPVLWFAGFFLLGFILLAAMFAAAGAMVSRQEDIGSTTTPVTMLVMLPYVLVIIFNDNDVVMTVLSYIPFSAPVAMPLRVYFGEALWWEPLVSLTVLVVTCVGAVLVGGRIYRASVLRMGSRVRLREAMAST